MIVDPEQKIGRPRQLYTGETLRKVLPMEERSSSNVSDLVRKLSTPSLATRSVEVNYRMAR